MGRVAEIGLLREKGCVNANIYDLSINAIVADMLRLYIKCNRILKITLTVGNLVFYQDSWYYVKAYIVNHG